MATGAVCLEFALDEPVLVLSNLVNHGASRMERPGIPGAVRGDPHSAKADSGGARTSVSNDPNADHEGGVPQNERRQPDRGQGIPSQQDQQSGDCNGGYYGGHGQRSVE
jgi:hypothetical protein